MIEIIKSAAKRMLIDFEDSQRIEHNVTKGRAREYSVFEQFLRPYLPTRYSVGSGIVIDASSRQSRQQDLVVYDELYSPKLLDIESDKVLFIESVFAVLEVKSVINRDELKDIIQKSASIWSLSKSPQPAISILPGRMSPTSHAPILCIGIGFESTMKLDAIPSIIREYHREVDAGHALSILCILKDKESKAGLVLNVASNNLRQIQLIPSSSTRLSLVRCDSPGDALLHLYLLLMEHLRYSGRITPGPNLLHYAELAGLKLPAVNVSPEEMRGASIELEGRLRPVDALEKIRVLSMKVIQGAATDGEILDWFLLLPQMPSGEAILNPLSRFFVNGLLSDMPGTLEVYRAVAHHQEGTATDTDSMLAKRLISLIQSIHTNKSELLMGIFSPSSAQSSHESSGIER
jgi:hypothetical protein